MSDSVIVGATPSAPTKYNRKSLRECADISLVTMKYGELPLVKLSDSESVNGFLVKIRKPPKQALLRLPTSAEMLERMRQTKLVRTSSGIIEEQNPEADVSLFEALRLDKDGPEFDDAEVQKALAKVSFVQVSEAEANDGEYRITLTTNFGEVVHVLSDPTEAELLQCRRKWIATRSLARGKSETRYPPEPAVKLYDSVIQSISGYADSFTAKTVPPDHKYAVVVALINKLDELDIAADPNS